VDEEETVTDNLQEQAATADEVARLREAVADLACQVSEARDLSGDLAERLDVADAIIRCKLGIALAPARAAEPLCQPVAYGDPVSTRIQSRKRRLEASGLVILPGGAQ
jgi:hypothetical protein